METIHIGTQNCTNELRERLDFELRFLEEEGIKVKIEEDFRGSLTFFDCNIPEGESLFKFSSPWIQRSRREVVINYLANALADIMIGNLERFFVTKIIENKYQYFDEEEREILLDKAMIQLSNYSSDGGIHYLPQIERKDRILIRIMEYLKENNQLILEGFIRFRLKDYFQELESAVEHAVEDHMMDKEYKEFIRLLKYFVDIQEPKVEEVNIVLRDDNIFRILDSNGNIIENEYLEGFIVQMAEEEIDYEDLLVSALITIAPEKIIVHFEENHPVLETLYNIFESRVTVCRGCIFCEMSRKNVKAKD
ncbi:MAG: putative sporulation protein YtxC [Halanaerobiales bacterium]|nr:putative sporulation protein YtxC [Halanaerobiales bacterium]